MSHLCGGRYQGNRWAGRLQLEAVRAKQLHHDGIAPPRSPKLDLEPTRACTLNPERINPARYPNPLQGPIGTVAHPDDEQLDGVAGRQPSSESHGWRAPAVVTRRSRVTRQDGVPFLSAQRCGPRHADDGSGHHCQPHDGRVHYARPRWRSVHRSAGFTWRVVS